MKGNTLESPVMQSENSDRLSQRNFQRLASYIENYCGIKVPLTKVTMIEGRLRKRVPSRGSSR